MGDPYAKLYTALQGFVERGVADDKGDAYKAINNMKSMLQRQLKRINYNYMRSVFFPEFTKGARYPAKFPVTSNVFTVKNTLTFVVPGGGAPVADGGQGVQAGNFGLILMPHIVSNTQAALYHFSAITQDSWGEGTPLLYNGKSILNTATDNSIYGASAGMYFQKHRLIGCSVIANTMNHSSGIWRTGVEYDIDTNKVMRTERVEERNLSVNYMGYFARESYELYNALSSRATFTAAIRANIIGRRVGGAEATIATVSMATIVSAVLGGAINTLADQVTQRKSWTGRIKAMFISTPRDEIAKEILAEYRTGVQNSYASYVKLAQILSDFNVSVVSAADGLKRGFNNGDDDIPGIAETERINLEATMVEVNLALDRIASRWTQTHAETLARMTKEMTGVVSNKMNSINYPNGPLNFQRIQETHYNHDSRGSEGIRSVFIPNREPSWEAAPVSDIMLIGAQGLTPGAIVTVQITRHFEGVTIPGIKDLFPGEKELPDEKVIRLVSSVFTLYPQILEIPPLRLQEYYNNMKRSFKWFDMLISERGGMMEIERPLSLPNNMLAQVQPPMAMPLQLRNAIMNGNIEEID